MPSADGTVLTDRQVEVLELRERGHTQAEVADRLGTTDSNVSAVERAATENVRKAEETLRLVRTVRSPVRFTVPEGTGFDTLVDEVYAQGDGADIKVSYCRPELYSHLYNKLEPYADRNRLNAAVEVGLSTNGDVTVLVEDPDVETRRT